LGVKQVFLPDQAGVLSALGMALAGLRRDFTRTLLWHGPRLTWRTLRQAYEDLVAEGLAEMAADGLEPHTIQVSGELQLRYLGQTYTLGVPLGPAFLEEFHARHQRLYGHYFTDRQVELVLLRLHCQAPEPPLRLSTLQPVFSATAVARPREARVHLPDGPAVVPVYYRPELALNFICDGPALITEDFATTLLMPGFQARGAAGGHLILEDRG
jgi:N-methylhydantoinase A/oxoprolinase/acetone carboxylase beta subunit